VADLPDAQRIAQLWGEPLEGIVLFGSQARGETWDTSDIDLLIVLPEGTPLIRSLYDRWDHQVAPYFDRRVSPSIVLCRSDASDVGSVWIEAAVDGVILLDRAGRIAHMFEQIRQDIATGKLLSGETHGHRYWYRPEPVA
jgi:predicted nucleotidyltransferase